MTFPVVKSINIPEGTVTAIYIGSEQVWQAEEASMTVQKSCDEDGEAIQ